MNWRTIFAESLASLKFHRRRTLITVSSLGWGVACFVMLISYGNGFDLALRSAFSAVGQDLIIMFEGQTSQQAGGLRAGRRIRLLQDDAQVLKDTLPTIGAISPESIMGNANVVRGTREKRYTLRAVWPEYSQIRNMRLVSGRWIDEEDNLRRHRVAVLGATAAMELFAAVPPEGEEITISGQRFSVIGVLETKGQLANYHRHDNQCIFLPYSTMSLFQEIRHPQYIVWAPVLPAVRDKAIRQVRATLAGLHNFSPTDEKAIEIMAFSKFMYIIDGMSLAVKILLGFIGALTLGVGGVGLANIMLAAVVDRTREIGVLKAVGTPNRIILAQFLAEAMVIVSIGGVLGILIGVLLTAAIGSMPLLGPLFRDAAGKGDLRLQVSAMSIVVSTGVLFTVGLVAGMIPAIKAARLDPIEALHYE